MGVSKNRGTPKWMVYNKKKPIKMDDLGVPLFLETPIYPCITDLPELQVPWFPFKGDADLRRRRSIPEPPYGYANRPQMMNNYGGTMPQQTPYGYSGWND